MTHTKTHTHYTCIIANTLPRLATSIITTDNSDAQKIFQMGENREGAS